MIFHGNRIKVREGADPVRVEEAMESLHEQGRTIPAVRSYIVGRESGTDFDWGAIFIFDDLEGYWEYLVHPAHARTERLGIPLMAKFETYDITDDDDPDFSAKVAELQKRHYETDPELVELMADLPSHTGSSALAEDG
ncbi:Dabb family protein [Actinoallomurus sp. CA-150999]|uniref:Dabb family protein n=1 Tax=Actinoallomurus sp. CA-150999 TaxID=3239887 RepID=UPI003D937CC5